MNNKPENNQKSSDSAEYRKDTKIVTAGRSKQWTQGVVNPPVIRASTIVFDSVAELNHAAANRANKVSFYGRRGTPTSFAFSDAMTELEGGVGCALYPCGTAAISNAILSFVEAGDHILMVDTAYEPTRDFCNIMLKKLGVETTFYDPLVGKGIVDLVQDNTRVIFLESPGSITMEVQDVPGICDVVKTINQDRSQDIITMLDNTWASPINFKPFEFGVDISIQAATKYIVGHSDVMIGTATANEKCWEQLRENSYLMGQCTSPDDIYLAMRGLRTIGVRLKQHEKNALVVAKWLAEREEVKTILHPAFESCPGHEYFKRDFLGGNGLFSFVLKENSRQGLTDLLDGMEHFKMGFSWGGYESLILGNTSVNSLRSATTWPYKTPLIRLHIGLEDPQDLIDDLAAGLARYNKALSKS